MRFLKIPINIPVSMTGIVLTEVEVPEIGSIPFVLVHFTLKGVPQRLGLRLDIGKGVFLDHVETAEDDRVLQPLAAVVVARVRSALNQGRANAQGARTMTV